MSKDKSQSQTEPPNTEAFLNRELTWLEFNRRVLHEALDERTPLLERVAFLAIFNSNLDEFFQKRVGGLKRQIAAGILTRTLDGLTPQEQLARIRAAVLPMLEQQADCYMQQIKPALATHGVHLLRWDELDEAEQQFARRYFRENLFPVLTPLAFDPGHPFPFISNLSTSLGVMLRPPPPEDGASPASDDEDPSGGMQFARVKVPEILPGWIRINPDQLDGQWRYVNLCEMIRHNLADLFEGMDIRAVEPFRISRNADVERDDDDAEDLLEMVEQELRERRFARAVRLEIENNPARPMARLLTHELSLEDQDVYEMRGELDYTDLWTIHEVNLPAIKYKPWSPVLPPRLVDQDANIFNVIRAGDVMVHHPYESFAASVERFISSAAADPDVIALKLTLYRTQPDSPFIRQMIRAAESGKQVVCLVELKARFDEQRNVQIAQTLEKAGVHVVYGLVGLKTHTKTALVVRRESMGLRCYAHIGTGNYHPKTAQLYTDLGLFTADPRLTGDLVELFHHLTGRSIKRDFPHLLIAPVNMRRRFMELIEREIEYAKIWRQQGGNPDDPDDVSAGRPRIIAKMNSLEDRKVCLKLYEASQAGVKIDLIVRGFCCLRPGVPGMSENISVISVIGRFLEHSRIFYFHNNGKAEYFIGSADWMYRNLSNRVECITPIYDQTLQVRLRQILDLMLADRRQAWDMQPDGTYVQRQPDPSDPATAIGTHERLMDLARREAAIGEME